MAKEWDRVLVVNDEAGRWYVRKVASAMHDTIHDEQVYSCDEPVGGSYATPLEAISAAAEAIGWGEGGA